MPLSSHMDYPPADWLQKAADGKLEITGVNVWKALRFRAYVQVIDNDGNVVLSVAELNSKQPVASKSVGSKPQKVKKTSALDKIRSFRVTKRGYDFLAGAGSASLPFNKSDPPLNVRLWVSSFRRWLRNQPESLVLAYADGEVRILVKDTEGKIKDDAAHRIASMKARWHEG